MAQQQYTIKAGDTLSGVASRYGVRVSDVTGYRSGDPNKVFAGETVTVNTRDTPAANKINAADLGATPFAAPPIVPKTGYAGLIESTNASISNYTPKVTSGEADIKGVYDKISGQRSKQVDLYETEGIYTKEKAYKDITNTITAKDAAYRRKIEKIRENNPTGQLSSGQTIAIEQVERDWAREKADLSISAAFARDDYVTAKSIVDDKIKAETEDLVTELDGLKFFYTQNYNKLSDAQKILLQQQTNEVQTELENKTTMLADLGNIQLEAAKNGAPGAVIVAIGKAEDTTGAIAAAGKYIGLYDRMAEERMGRKGSGSGSGVNFSDTQIANGAANAGVTMSQFNGFDEDTKNFFINGDISGAKKSIDDAFLNENATLDEVKSEIEGMNLPQKGADMLLQYAQDSYDKNAYTIDDFKTDAINDLRAQKQSGKNRASAYNAVRDAFLKESALTDEEVAALNAAIDEVYGKRTFMSKILPGGN